MLKALKNIITQWWVGLRLDHAAGVRSTPAPARNPGEGIPIGQTEEGKLFIQIATKGCPDCGSRRFAEGPSGGMMTNIQCENGHRFNIAPMLSIAHRI